MYAFNSNQKEKKAESLSKNTKLLDLMATMMDTAAKARNIETRIFEIDADTYRARADYWLGFSLCGQEFCYAKGALLENGKDRWGNSWRNLNHKAELLVADKYSSKLHLKERGFSVPEGRFFRRRNLQSAFDSFSDFSGPICVKPNNSSEGKCVSTSIVEQKHFFQAIEQVAEQFPNILIEDSVEGGHYRFFYVHPEVVAIRQGVPMSVVGDGYSNVKKLVEEKNLERMQRAIPMHPVFKVDENALGFLTSQGLSLNYVPPACETVFLCGASNSTVSADTILYNLDQVHHSYLDIVKKACMSVPGLHISGVDIIIQDISQPANHDNHWLLELNTSPYITSFYYPWKGNIVDVAGKILDMLEANYPL